MGRELKRKQAKREGKNVKEAQEKVTEKKELSPKTFLTILGVILLFLVFLFLITGIFVTKDIKWFEDKKEDVEENSNAISNKILAKDSLRQQEEDYYVYYYDPSDEDNTVSSIIAMLSEKVYRVDLSDEFNSNFIGEESGIVGSIEDLKVSIPTVIKVSGEKIVEFYAGTEKIQANLK